MNLSRRELAALTLTAMSGAAASVTAAEASPLDGSQGSGGAKTDGLVVPEHFVPTPRTISPQAQAFLRLDLTMGGHPAPTSPDDKAGWQAYKDAGNRGMVAMTKPYAERYPGEVVNHKLSASTLYEVTPRNLAPENAERAILYVHGGGFTVGGGEAAIYPAMQMAGLAKTRVFSIDYRMVPEFPYPAPLEDTVEGYRFMLKRFASKNVAIFGPSAGANLAPTAILKARDHGLPLPAACAMHSCPSDMGDMGDTAFTNVVVDIILKQRDPQLSLGYAGGHDLKDPYLSPVYADFSKGFPPSILTSGTRDILLSSTVRLHRALVRGGVKAELHVFEAMTHAPFFNAPEEMELYNQHIGFMLDHMGKA
jgi:acetyl esterase/lipase